VQRLGATALGVPLCIPLCILFSAPVSAATNLSGMAVDSITGRPLAGVLVQARRAEVTLRSATTEGDGTFQILVELPQQPAQQSLDLVLSRDGYTTVTHVVTVSAGRADQLSYRLVLPRSEAADCAPTWARTVVVGHVRQPISATRDLALSRRIGEVLQYDLLAEVQKTHLPSDQQPIVLACPKAEPRDLMEHSLWAKALKADAFVAGAAEPVEQRFRVDLQVSASHGEAGLPALASTPPLNLDRPQSADLGRSALTPIVLALLRAYAAEGRYAECVEFAGAAQRALGVNPEVRKLRESCQAKLPNSALLVEGGGR
jgi:hypothetical protein